ncbi:hypothetical protein DEO72_LG2g2961 [Vigna unguiculata]|uniref:Uncharacterized protein n=1 Tax=Vigna unguiculata TaxID=3917 RepID=A0A4D6L288_VIGUN|nr:hypothetical protein DEO72_LG2g2961 [Vigna unguiculata]
MVWYYFGEIIRDHVVNNRQAIATTSVRSGRIPPGGEKGIARRLRWKQCVRIGDAPDSVNCSARRYLQLLEILRRLAPGGVIYKAFNDASKVGLLVFLELSSEHIP